MTDATAISDYTTVAGDNVLIDAIDIDEGWSPADVNNAFRALMSHLAEWYQGSLPGIFTDLTVTGDTIIGNAAGDALTFHPSAWTLSNAVTITGTWADLGAVTTADINGGTIDGVTIGGASAPTVTDLGSVATCDINGGTIDGSVIGGASAAAGTFTTLNTSGAVVFNEAGADVDFRVESDGNANMLFVDGGNDRVGFGTNSPDGTLHVYTASAGTISADGSANELVLENSTDGGLSILTPNTAKANIYIGDEDDAVVGGLQYDHADDTLDILAANATLITLASGVINTFAYIQKNEADGYLIRVNNVTGTDTGNYGLYYNDTSEYVSLYAASIEKLRISGSGDFQFNGGNVGIGLAPTANMVGISVEAGVITLKETTTPTADVNYGKIYPKSDNKLYFQDGAGAEHEIAFA